MDSTDQILDVIEGINTDINSYWAEELTNALNTLAKETADSSEITTSIKMMRALSKYLNARKAQAYPEALPALKSIGQNIKEMKNASSPEKKSTIYAGSLATFKHVKSAIESGKVLTEKESEELKAVILSLDWEISDMTMKGFDSVLTRLEKRLPDKKAHHIFLRLMHQIGVYIARTKSNAHKDAVPLLQSVFQNYEKLTNHPDMTPADQKQLVQKNISAFNSFKRKIEAGPAKETESIKLDVSRPVPKTPLTPAFPSPPKGTVPRTYDPAANEAVVPALNHLGSSVEIRDEIPLVTLDDPLADPAPLLADGSAEGRPPEKETPRDIMEDLFFPKESAADELLDAIHLAHMHGPEQENTPGLSPFMQEKPKQPGTKEFTPKRMAGQPLPEIEQRLNAFFNMKASEPEKAAPKRPEPAPKEALPEMVPLKLVDDPATEVRNEPDVQHVIFKLVSEPPEIVEGLFLSHDLEDEASIPQNETHDNDTELPMAEYSVTDDEIPQFKDEDANENEYEDKETSDDTDLPMAEDPVTDDEMIVEGLFLSHDFEDEESVPQNEPQNNDTDLPMAEDAVTDDEIPEFEDEDEDTDENEYADEETPDGTDLPMAEDPVTDDEIPEVEDEEVEVDENEFEDEYEEKETPDDTDLPMPEDTLTDDERLEVEDEDKETNAIPLEDKTPTEEKGFFAWLKRIFRR